MIGGGEASIGDTTAIVSEVRAVAPLGLVIHLGVFIAIFSPSVWAETTTREPYSGPAGSGAN